MPQLVFPTFIFVNCLLVFTFDLDIIYDTQYLENQQRKAVNNIVGRSTSGVIAEVRICRISMQNIMPFSNLLYL